VCVVPLVFNSKTVQIYSVRELYNNIFVMTQDSVLQLHNLFSYPRKEYSYIFTIFFQVCHFVSNVRLALFKVHFYVILFKKKLR